MLGGGGRRGMGGGGGGGGIMKTFQKAVRAGVGGALLNTNNNIGGAKGDKAKKLNNKRPTSPTKALTLSPYSSAPFSPLISFPTLCSDESEWEYVAGIEDETAARAFYDDYVFGTVPSRDEVKHAVSALQHALGMEKVGEVASEDFAANPLGGSEMEWDEPSQSLYMLQHPRSDMAYEAFRLLQTEPSVQRMVVSLSSDQAVWDAVMNNEAVKELRGSIHEVGEGMNEGSVGEVDGDGDENILNRILMFAKAKIMQVLEKITELLSSGLQEKEMKGDGDVNQKVKNSIFLSIIVLIIVVITRANTNNA